mgnify:CR=1 FL=1
MNQELVEKPDATHSQHSLAGHSHNPLSAYCYYPDGVDFSERDSDEKIVLLLRRHMVTNLKWVVVATFMALAPVILQFFPILNFLPQNYQFMGVLVWYLITTAFVLEAFLSWFYNVNIITNKRVIDVDFVNLLYKEVTIAAVDKVQDVTVRVGSVIRTMFDYGDVFVQTASEIQSIEFEAVPHPEQVSHVLHELKEAKNA